MHIKLVTSFFIGKKYIFVHMGENVLKGLHFPPAKVPWVLFAEHWAGWADFYVGVDDDLVGFG